MMFKPKALRKLCMAGVISPALYFQLKVARKRKTKTSSYSRLKRFDLAKFTDDDSALLFRFSRDEIHRLEQALNLPKMFKLRDGTKVTGQEGLCILLRRLSYPARLTDLCKLFYRDSGTLSRIFNYFLKYIFRNFGKLLFYIEQPWMDNCTFGDFAQACNQAGSYYPHIVGFIDGTCRPICRPKYKQRLQYSGYKKGHMLKYQGIVFPNGLIGRLDGPFKGHRHDSAILHLSKVKNEMAQKFEKNNFNYSVYGDIGYANQHYIKVGFKNHQKLSERQKTFNKEMSVLRVSVEYGFGKILQQFAYLDFKKNQQMYLQNLRHQYFVATFLVNCQTCLRGGNQISKFFYCRPPSLEKYLTM